jgi:hypothetical protein
MKLSIPNLVALMVLLAGCGLVHGLWSGRWAEVHEVEVKNLLDFEGAIGDWQAGEFVAIDAKDLPKGQQTVARRFVNPKSKKSVVLSVSAGHPGIVSVHTPDVCYLGTGYRLKGAVRRESNPVAESPTPMSCYTADFEKQSVAGSDAIRVRWSWSSHGEWQAPDSPRFHFIRAGVLYKLYLVHPLADEADLTKDDPYRKFVADLVPHLNRRLGR